MRQALARCSFLPGSTEKRFARQAAAIPLEKITERQKRFIVQLAYRFRRQMPWDLVPSKDAIEMHNRDVQDELATRYAERERRLAARRDRKREIANPSLFAS